MSGRPNPDVANGLTYQRAIDIARSTEGELDPAVKQYLDDALASIWSRIEQEPDSYVLTEDEFAVFNFFAHTFDNYPEEDKRLAEQAIARYWRVTRRPSG